MAEFPVFSEVSASLIRLLRGQLCPDPVPSPESIQLASPADKNADYHLGVFLYDIREVSECRRSERVRGADNRLAYPSRPMSLHYVLYLNGKAQIASGAEAEQRILGRALQALSDNVTLPLPESRPEFGPPEEDPSISFPNLPFEDKSKVWAAVNAPYQLGVFCVVSTVHLSSRHETRAPRVTSVEIGSGPIGGRGR